MPSLIRVSNAASTAVRAIVLTCSSNTNNERICSTVQNGSGILLQRIITQQKITPDSKNHNRNVYISVKKIRAILVQGTNS